MTDSASSTNGISSPALPLKAFEGANLFDSGMEALLTGETIPDPPVEPSGEDTTEESTPVTEPLKEEIVENEEQKEPEKEESTEEELLESLALGDKTYEIPLDAELTFIVNGKEEKLSIKEIKQQFSGKVAYEKKYQELADNRKRFQADVQRVDTKLKNLLSLATSDPESCLIELVRMRGGTSPEQAVAVVMKAIEDAQNEWGGLSEEQRNFRIKEKTLVAKERALKTKEEQEENLKTQINTESYILSVLNQEGIPVEEFKTAWKEIEQMHAKGDVDLSGKSHKELADITLGYIESTQTYKKIQNAIRRVDESRVTDKDLVQEIKRRIDSDFTEDDIVDILQEGFSLGSNSKNPTKGQTPTQKAPQKKEDPKAKKTEEWLSKVDDLLTSPF